MNILGCLLKIGEKSLQAQAVAEWAWGNIPEPDIRKPAGQDFPQGPATLGTVAPPPYPMGSGAVSSGPEAACPLPLETPSVRKLAHALPPSPGLGCRPDSHFCSLWRVTLLSGAVRVTRTAYTMPRPEGPDNLCSFPSPPDQGAERKRGS